MTCREVLALAEAHPRWVAVSPTRHDAISLLVTLSASSGTAPLDAAPAPLEALRIMGSLAELVFHRLLRPATADDPGEAGCQGRLLQPGALLLRHLHDLQGGDGRRLRYGEVPAATQGPSGGILDGAGPAVSAHIRKRLEGGEFLGWIATDEIQRDILVPAGG